VSRRSQFPPGILLTSSNSLAVIMESKILHVGAVSGIHKKTAFDHILMIAREELITYQTNNIQHV